MFAPVFVPYCAWYHFALITRVSTISHGKERWICSNGASASAAILDVPLCSEKVMPLFQFSKFSTKVQVILDIVVFIFAAMVGAFFFVEPSD